MARVDVKCEDACLHISPRRMETNARQQFQSAHHYMCYPIEYHKQERNMTDWAKERLKELLSGITFVIPNVGSVIEVVKLKELEGDASVTFVRGKKK